MLQYIGARCCFAHLADQQSRPLQQKHAAHRKRILLRAQHWISCACRMMCGILFSVFALAVDRFVTIGRRTAQFCFGLLMRCLFFGLPLPSSRLLTHATRRALCTLAGTWEQIRTKILRAFGGMMAGPLVATCLGPLLIVL